MKQDKKISTIKFIACLTIVFSHAYNLDIYDVNIKAICIIEKTAYLFSQTAVAMFFFLSGYLFFVNIKETKINVKLKRRVKTLLIPYIIWSTIYYLYFVIVTNIPFLKKYTTLNIYNFSLKNWIFFIFNTNKITPLWYMETLLVCIILTPIFYQILKRRKLCLFIILIMFIFCSSHTINIFNISIFNISYFFYFLFGSFASYYMMLKNNSFISYLSLFCIIIFVFYIYLNSNISFVMNILIILSIWYVLDLVNVRIDASYIMFIYAFHEIPLEIIAKINNSIFHQNKLFALYDFIFSPILTIIISLIIAKFLKKSFNKFYQLITGDR